jgi:putative membrane protein
MSYFFLKWLHFIAIISWMAGILYLYRLLVYLAERGSEPKIHELLCLMSRRLYRYITFPAMIVGFAAGIGMILTMPALMSQGWIHAKLTLLLMLGATTIYAGVLTKRFETKDIRVPSGKKLRFLNEVPTILMMLIVALAVFRPF